MPIKEHYEIKDQLLEIIERQNTTPTKFEREQVSRTDWHVDRAQIREYFKFIFPIVYPYMHQLMEDAFNKDEKIYDIDHIKISSYRMNRYEKSDYHGWHRHPNSSWHFIYYVELPEGAPGTEIQIPFTNERVRPDVKEGDLLMSPSCFLHRGPPNDSKGRKTIIVMNTN